MSITNPNVSVIVPAFNAAKTLPTCLKSILKQNYPTRKVEIIVINDGSTDKTITFLRSFTLSERFKVIRHSENCGLAAARNTG
ncbi:MAG: glycosyltransferase family 2 protein, partial [Candidatus Marinimicrobia bacterium]|nr:glycosyltransferase family 2 protein [Candidatus Neomarinimicrobiota bacterium]